VSSWHSSALSWDGLVPVMGWEPGGNVEAECEAGDPDLNKSAFFDTVTGELLGTWVLPWSQRLRRARSTTTALSSPASGMCW